MQLSDIRGLDAIVNILGKEISSIQCYDIQKYEITDITNIMDDFKFIKKILAKEQSYEGTHLKFHGVVYNFLVQDEDMYGFLAAKDQDSIFIKDMGQIKTIVFLNKSTKQTRQQVIQLL